MGCFPISSMSAALKSGSGQDEKLIINFMWPYLLNM